MQQGRYTSAANALSIPGFYGAGRVVKAMGAVPALIVGALAIGAQHFLEGFWVKGSLQQFCTLPFFLLRGLTTAALNTLFLEAGQDRMVR